MLKISHVFSSSSCFACILFCAIFFRKSKKKKHFSFQAMNHTYESKELARLSHNRIYSNVFLVLLLLSRFVQLVLAGIMKETRWTKQRFNGNGYGDECTVHEQRLLQCIENTCISKSYHMLIMFRYRTTTNKYTHTRIPKRFISNAIRLLVCVLAPIIWSFGFIFKCNSNSKKFIKC